MEKLVIGTWNIENSYFKLHKNSGKINAIKDLLLENNIDILSLQCVNDLVARELAKEAFNIGYRIDHIPNYSFTSLGDIKKENNLVIVKDNFSTMSEITKLSSVPKTLNIKDIIGMRSRNVNKVLVKGMDDKGKKVIVFNTHLEPNNNALNRKQLEELGSMIDREGIIPPIITGTLNRKIYDDSNNMLWFLYEYVYPNDMNDIRTGCKTYSGHDDEWQVDYIIVPKSFEVDDVMVDTKYEKVSKHYPVLAQVRFK